MNRAKTNDNHFGRDRMNHKRKLNYIRHLGSILPSSTVEWHLRLIFQAVSWKAIKPQANFPELIHESLWNLGPSSLSWSIESCESSSRFPRADPRKLVKPWAKLPKLIHKKLWTLKSISPSWSTKSCETLGRFTQADSRKVVNPWVDFPELIHEGLWNLGLSCPS